MASNPLTKQIGPLPAGMWLLVIGGGLFVGYMVNKNMAKPNSEPTSQQLTETGVGTGGGQLVYEPPQTSTPDNNAIETNAEWGRQAVNHLIALNYDPNAADTAITKYLTGQPRSAAEAAMVAIALAALKAPPESVPLPEGQPPASEPPTTHTKPNPVTNLHIRAATRRNDIIWNHDGKNITHFYVVAKARATGEETVTYVGAYSLPNLYVWSHFLFAGATQNYTYDYTVVPWNVDVYGEPRSVASNFNM